MPLGFGFRFYRVCDEQLKPIGLLGLQAAADWLTPDELEAWCSRCAFGTGRAAIGRVIDHDVKLRANPSQKDFVNAMTEQS